MIEEGLFAHLSSDAGVVAMVASRIFPLIIPQRSADVLLRDPCLVYARIDARRQQKFCGTDDLIRSVFQLDCYARTYPDARGIAAANRAALIDFRGTMGSVEVKAVFLDSQADLVEPDPGLYRIEQRFIVWHDEIP